MSDSPPTHAVATTRPVFDAHVDIVYALQQPGAPTLADSLFAPPRLAANGVRIVTSAVFCADAHNGPTAAAHLAALLTTEEQLLGGLPLLETNATLQEIWQGGGRPGRLRLLENADALLEFGVASAVAAGIVTVGLTHVGANRLADGNAVAAPGGLTTAGRRLLAELAAAGRAVDVAHLAPPGFWQVVADYPGPLLCSHTGLRHFRDLPRNLAADQLEALGRRGGVVGLAFAPGLLAGGPETTLAEVFRQLDWLVEHCGWEMVGIGSDFGGFAGVCRGLDDYAGLAALAGRMEQAGYPDVAIAGILGENWRRFYAGLLPG